MTNENKALGREITMEKTVHAPLDLVWQAWTSPKMVGNWWGPNGFSCTIHEMDVKPGGVWRLTMHGPDGTDYPNTITYREIEKAERLVYDHGKPGEPGYHEMTVLFFNEGDKTRLSLRMVFNSPEEKEEIVKKFGAEDGLKQTLGRLSDYLEKRKS